MVGSPQSSRRAEVRERKALLLEAYQQKFDLVVFWRLDRFSREGALTTLRYLKEFKDYGVDYESLAEPYLDSPGPFGDVIVSMLATIAAQALIKISENTKAALARKKAAGVKLGNQGKSPAQMDQIQRLKGGGLSSYAIGKAMGSSASTVAKYLANQRNEGV